MTGQLVSICLGVSAIIGAGFAIIKGGVWLWRVLQKLARLTDDLTGEPPRPGMPDGRPGVLDRLLIIEQGQDAMKHQLEATIASWEQRLARVEAQLLPAPHEPTSL